MPDISTLTIIKPDLVESFLNNLNNHIQNAKSDKKLIAAIGTGGTISMKIKDGIRVPDLDFQSILSHTAQDLSDNFDIISLDAMCIDSSQMDYSHVRELAIAMTYIWQNLSAPIAGFLVLHGTDTMAHSAAALSLMMGPGLPFSVVYTGGQKSIQEPMNDSAHNIRHALYTLDTLHNQDMAEIVIVMGDRAILGTSAVKINDTLADAFDAPLHQYIANFTLMEYPVRLAAWLQQRRRHESFNPTIPQTPHSHTLVVHSALGLDPKRLQRQIQDKTVKAVLLFSYGAGTAHDDIIDIITTTCTAKNIPAFVVNPVNTEYKIAYESGKKLVSQGIIPLYMTLPSALAKVEVALTLYHDDITTISNFMSENYVGEIPSQESRFSPLLRR